MAVKNTDETPAAVEPVTQVPEPAPAKRGLGGLAIAGIVVGGVIAAGALFGGGMLVGSHLPDGGDRFSQSQFGPGGDRPTVDGERPGMPGHGDRDGS